MLLHTETLASLCLEQKMNWIDRSSSERYINHFLSEIHAVNADEHLYSNFFYKGSSVLFYEIPFGFNFMGVGMVWPV